MHESLAARPDGRGRCRKQPLLLVSSRNLDWFDLIAPCKVAEWIQQLPWLGNAGPKSQFKLSVKYWTSLIKAWRRGTGMKSGSDR